MKPNMNPAVRGAVEPDETTNNFIIALETTSSSDKLIMWETFLQYHYEDYERSKSEQDTILEQRRLLLDKISVSVPRFDGSETFSVQIVNDQGSPS